MAQQAAAFPNFRLLTSTQVHQLLYDRGGVRRAGRHARRPDPRAQPVGGRHRRPQLGSARTGGAQQPILRRPRDVLWMKLSKQPGDPARSMGHTGPKQNFIMIDRGDYWQCGYSIDKGSFDAIRRSGRRNFAAPRRGGAIPDDRLQEIVEWDQVKLLSIRIDRLDRWAKPGAVHRRRRARHVTDRRRGRQPAIQDAVAAANALIPPLRQHRLQLKHLLSVQRRREFPTRAIQFLQIKMSQRKPGERRAAGGSRLIARVGNSRWLPRLFGRIIGRFSS